MRLLGVLGALYLGYAALAWAAQRAMLYPGRHLPVPEGLAERIPGLERLWLPTAAGRVEAWWLPVRSRTGSGAGAPSPAVIFGHGNAEHVDDWPAFLLPYRALGCGVLLVEFPGYGRSQGSPSEAAIVEAFVAGYDALLARPEVDPARIVLHGRSLGGGAVALLSERRAAAALILQSCFTSVRAFAAGMLLPGALVKDPFDAERAVGLFRGPVLVLHGAHDTIVPPRHARALAAAAGERGRLLFYPAGHNDFPPDWDVFWRDVEAFLRQAGVLPAD